MNRPISVVVVDTSESFRQLLSERINAEDDMFVAAMAGNGAEASEIVAQQQPDVLITELLLREIEGLALIRQLKEKGSLPHTILISGFFSDYVAEKASDLGVERFFPKPCNVGLLIETVRSCCAEGKDEPCQREHFRRMELERNIEEALIQSGVMPYLRGREYLKAALMAAAEDKSLLSGVTKILYPELARRFSTSSGNLERCIRSAIDIAWRDGDREKREAYFGPIISALMVKKPGNTKYMKLLLEHIEANKRRPEY